MAALTEQRPLGECDPCPSLHFERREPWFPQGSFFLKRTLAEHQYGAFNHVALILLTGSGGTITLRPWYPAMSDREITLG